MGDLPQGTGLQTMSAPQFLCSACRTDADVPIGLKRYCVCSECGRWDYCLEVRGGKAAFIAVEHHGRVVQRGENFVTEGEHWMVRGKRFDHEPSADEIAAAAGNGEEQE